MIHSFRLIILILFLFTSCNDENKSKETVSSIIEKFTDQDPIIKVSFELVDYPEDFLKENELEEWDEFRSVYETMDRLKELDLRDIEVNIIGLSSLLKDLISENLPEEFETPQLRSRLKVVQMQTQKARYFTRHYKKDSLIPSLKDLYGHYNAFVNRMIVFKQEQTTVISNSLTIP
jgi:regulator of replication initiation timing